MSDILSSKGHEPGRGRVFVLTKGRRSGVNLLPAVGTGTTGGEPKLETTDVIALITLTTFVEQLPFPFTIFHDGTFKCPSANQAS